MERTIARLEDEMRRAVAQLPLFLLVLLLASNARAQSGIPDGVFVRESNGTTWLVLKGQRVGVPVWQASDADIAAIPASDQWAVTSVNDTGAMVAGSKPAWLSAQESAPTAASPQTVAAVPTLAVPSPSRTDAPIQSAQQGTVGADLLYARVQRSYSSKPSIRWVATVRNSGTQALKGVRIRLDTLDANGVLLVSTSKTMMPLAAGASLTLVAGTSDMAADPSSSVIVVENAGTPTTDVAPDFTIEDVAFAKKSNATTTDPDKYQVSAVISTSSDKVKRFQLVVATVLRGADGAIIGASYDWAPSNLPESLTPGAKARIDITQIPTFGVPAKAEVFAYLE